MSKCQLCHEFRDTASGQALSYYRRLRLTDVRESARNGCHTCQLFQFAFNAFRKDLRSFSAELVLLEIKRLFSGEVQLDVIVYQQKPSSLQEHSFGGQPPSLELQLVNLSDLSPPVASQSQAWTDLFPSESDGSSSSKFPGYSISPDPLSRASLAVIGKWINTCLTTHLTCEHNEQLPPELPTRVVAISDTTVTLKVTHGDRARYLALSHCWGEAPICRLLKQNVEAYQRSIPWADLSTNFQDAVEVAKKLNVNYIWIDALCIIQDSFEDWEREAARMGSVYRNAFLTIAATSAVDGSQGFLQQRPEAVPMPSIITGSKSPNLYVRKTALHHPFTQRNETGDENTPLLSRAWVYQERVLSPRVLHFLHEEMIFECRKQFECECGLVNRYISPMTFQRNFKHEFFESLDLPPEQMAEAWATIVREYSVRDLSVITDKLPALSAMASMFRPKMGDYLCGFWVKSLPIALAWRLGRLEKPIRKIQEIPTWSWAHTHGGLIVFPDLDFPEVATELLDADVSLLGKDPFGRITSGWVQLKGLATLASLKDNGRSWALCRGDLQEQLYDDDGFSKDNNMYVPGMAVTCILIAYGRNTTSDSLALKVVDEEQQIYQRIGMFILRPSPWPWYGGAEQKVFTIM